MRSGARAHYPYEQSFRRPSSPVLKTGAGLAGVRLRRSLKNCVIDSARQSGDRHCCLTSAFRVSPRGRAHSANACAEQSMESAGCISVDAAAAREYDAVVVPGGGLEPSGLPRPWVCARLDAAVRLAGAARYAIVLSRGTTHRPPPHDPRGFPIDEAAASAAYLLRNGLDDPSRVLLDAWSLDTIGNAYYTRQMLATPLALRRLVVVTSAFHMPRTRAIFEWVFQLPSAGSDTSDDRLPHFMLDFCETPDRGLEPEELEARVQKERSALATLLDKTIPRITSLESLAMFLHVEHGAYMAKSALNALSLAEDGKCEKKVGQKANKLLDTY